MDSFSKNCSCHHMTPCCTVCLGPDFQAVPASSGVSVTSTITLLLFHSHKPLCQSSQNQTDGAGWQQKACKSWIIWLEILFNYSTKWTYWRGLNTCCLLYNMCKQLLQYSTNKELHKRWKLGHCYLKGLWSIYKVVQFVSWWMLLQECCPQFCFVMQWWRGRCYSL